MKQIGLEIQNTKFQKFQNSKKTLEYRDKKV